jgi:hypothetical protein
MRAGASPYRQPKVPLASSAAPTVPVTSKPLCIHPSRPRPQLQSPTPRSPPRPSSSPSFLARSRCCPSACRRSCPPSRARHLRSRVHPRPVGHKALPPNTTLTSSAKRHHVADTRHGELPHGRAAPLRRARHQRGHERPQPARRHPRADEQDRGLPRHRLRPAQAVRAAGRWIASADRDSYLPAIGRFLIVVTFLEDALRIITQWGDQLLYLHDYRHSARPPTFATAI